MEYWTPPWPYPGEIMTARLSNPGWYIYRTPGIGIPGGGGSSYPERDCAFVYLNAMCTCSGEKPGRVPPHRHRPSSSPGRPRCHWLKEVVRPTTGSPRAIGTQPPRRKKIAHHAFYRHGHEGGPLLQGDPGPYQLSEGSSKANADIMWKCMQLILS